MAHGPEVRAAVRRGYVHERRSLEEASSRASVSYHTARRWKRQAAENGDDWDKARAAARMAQGGLGDLTAQVLEDFALLFQQTMEEIRDGQYDGLKKAEALSRLSDAYTKTVKSAAGAEPKIAKLSVALEVLEELAKFIKEHFSEDLPRFAAILEPFGARVSEVFG